MNARQEKFTAEIREQLTDSMACFDISINVPEEEREVVSNVAKIYCDDEDALLIVEEILQGGPLWVQLDRVDVNRELLALCTDAPMTAELLEVVVMIGAEVTKPTINDIPVGCAIEVECESCGEKFFENEDHKCAEAPDVHDGVHCCPNCERPNQFGEVCSDCLSEEEEHEATR